MKEEKTKSQFERLDGLKTELATAKEQYLSLVHRAPQPQVDAASAEVKRLQQAVSDCITEGAKPCPKCQRQPFGMQQTAGDHVGFEIGCLGCYPFKYNRETVEFRVRGALLPRHAVEAWNEGPVAWHRKTKPTGG